MQAAYEALSPLQPEERARAMHWLAAELDVADVVSTPPPASAGLGEPGGDGGGKSPHLSNQTPKAFLAEKKPRSAVERIACLGYYLSHFRNKSTFKAADLTALNTEAAGQRFTSASRDFDNADRGSGYLVGANNGQKQLSIRGEAVVVALPDREAVKHALKEHKFKRRSNSRRTKALPSGNGKSSDG
jgi:hypothetical protein